MSNINFGNFPNMGYCAIENTVKSMRQVIEGLSEARCLNPEKEFNQYERRAYNELYEMCEAMMEEMTRLEEADEEEYDEEDEEYFD